MTTATATTPFRYQFLLVPPVLAMRISLVYWGKSASLYVLRHPELEGIHQLVYNPYYLTGISTLVIASLFWLLILKRMQLNRAYAILSLQYIGALAVAAIAFDERITPYNILGALFIVGGVILVNTEDQA